MLRIVAGAWGGRRIAVPDGREVRPTSDRVKEAWFSAIGSRIEGARVLDLFAGSGALGLEALSRGAASATFVERDRKALGSLVKNIEVLSAGAHAAVVPSDVFRFLEDTGTGSFDVALADPPYERGIASRLLRTMIAEPFAHELWLEHASRESLGEWPGLRQRRYGDTTLSTWEIST